MRFALTGTAILAYISLATSHVIKRDISIVLRGLSTLNANIGTFGASVYRYDGTLPAAIEIFHQESSLEKDLEGVAADTNSTAEWTAQESNSVTESLVGLEPIMRTSIAALVMKVGSYPETYHSSARCSDILISREISSSAPAWALQCGLIWST